MVFQRTIFSRGFPLCLRALSPAVAFKTHLPLYRILCCRIDSISPYSNVTGKDIVLPGGGGLEKPAAGSEDLLMQQLKSAKNFSRIMGLAAQHYSVMNNQHLLLTFQQLANLKRDGQLPSTGSELMTQDSFVQLCTKLNKRARFYQVQDVLTLIKCMSFLGVPTRTTIMQGLLKLLSHQVNELTLSEVAFASLLLERLGRSPLVDALRLALPIVFQSQADYQLDSDNCAELARYLQFISQSNMSSDVFERTVLRLLRCQEEMEPETAVSIFWSLCSYRGSLDAALSLLAFVQNQIADEVNSISPAQMIITLKKMALGVHKMKNEEVYHEEICDNICSLAVERRLGVSECIEMTRFLMSLSHVHPPFLHYITSLIISENEKKSVPFSHVLTAVRALSGACERPHDLERLFKIFMDSFHAAQENEEKDLASYPWIKVNCDVAALGFSSDVLISRAFSPTSLNLLTREKDPLRHFELLTLWRAVKCFRSEYNGPLPDENLLSASQNILKKYDGEFPLKGAIESAMGGPSYVCTKVFTQHGFLIDHVVVMRKGDYPVSITSATQDTKKSGTSYPESLDDIILPLDGKMVALLVLKPNQMARNIERMKGITSLMIQLLEKEGLVVVPVSLHAFSQLLDYEKIPYLMQKIRDHCASHNSVASII